MHIAYMDLVCFGEKCISFVHISLSRPVKIRFYIIDIQCRSNTLFFLIFNFSTSPHVARYCIIPFEKLRVRLSVFFKLCIVIVYYEIQINFELFPIVIEWFLALFTFWRKFFMKLENENPCDTYV